MSLRLRVQYQVCSIRRLLTSFRIPAMLTGVVSRVMIGSLVIFLLVGYIVKISHLTTGGYEIATMEAKVASLTDESRKLSAEVASYQSIASIRKRLPELAMVPAKNISYLKATALTMAER